MQRPKWVGSITLKTNFREWGDEYSPYGTILTLQDGRNKFPKWDIESDGEITTPSSILFYFISGPISSNLGTRHCKMAFGSSLYSKLKDSLSRLKGIITRLGHRSILYEAIPTYNRISSLQFTLHATMRRSLTHMSTVTRSSKRTSSSKKMDPVLRRWWLLSPPIVLLTEALQEVKANPDMESRLPLSVSKGELFPLAEWNMPKVTKSHWVAGWYPWGMVPYPGFNICIFCF